MYIYICRWLFFHVFPIFCYHLSLWQFSFCFWLLSFVGAAPHQALIAGALALARSFFVPPSRFFSFFFWALTEIKKQMCVKSDIKTVCPRQLEQTHAMVLPVSSVSVSLSFLFLRPLSRSWWSPSPLSSWMSGTFPKTHLLTPSKIWAGGGYLNLCINWMGPLWPILSFYCTVTAHVAERWVVACTVTAHMLNFGFSMTSFFFVLSSETTKSSTLWNSAGNSSTVRIVVLCRSCKSKRRSIVHFPPWAFRNCCKWRFFI